jgi:hypothetical protein
MELMQESKRIMLGGDAGDSSTASSSRETELADSQGFYTFPSIPVGRYDMTNRSSRVRRRSQAAVLQDALAGDPNLS